MPASFIRGRPLQALELAAAVAVLAFAGTGLVGVLSGQELNGLLYLAFFPMVLAIVVGAETLLVGYRLARAAEPVARITARRWYTAIRALEMVMTIATLGLFCVLIVQLGSEVPGPGAIGLLFVGIALGLLAYGAVILQTLTEY